ncbi:MAG: ABC transporter permease, partial [Tropicimonas sp.]
MLLFILKRLSLAVLVALTVSAISFSLLFLAGDPALPIAGENASSEDIAAITERYGFDRPLPVQYIDWLAAAARGDFGRSWYFDMPTTQVI